MLASNRNLLSFQPEKHTVDLPAIVVYKTTNDTSALGVDQLHIFLDASSDTTYEVLALYTFHNSSELIVAVPMGNQQEIPFLKYPTGAQPMGYQAMQDSASFVSTSDGFAIPPMNRPMGSLPIRLLPKQKETSITQPFVLPIASVNIFVPDGLELKGDQLTKGEPQDVQGSIYQLYTAENLNAGDELTFTVSGSPKASSSTALQFHQASIAIY